MLENDPPPGTPVVFVREVRKARANERGTLVRPLRKYLVEQATDEFEVEIRGERMLVQRRDIKKA